MSMRRKRVLIDLDREIDTTTAHLEALRTARRAVARTLPVTGRRPPVPDPTEASLEALIGALMADGRTWDVDATYEAVKRSGVPTDRAAINSILYRGSRRADGRFAAVARG